jgi:hypothetical protein
MICFLSKWERQSKLVFQQVVPPAVGFQDDQGKLTVLLNQHLDLAPGLQELRVEGDQPLAAGLPFSLDYDFPADALVVDAFDDEAALSMHVLVGTSYFVDLLESAHPLRQVAASFLQYLLPVLVREGLQIDTLLLAADEEGELVPVKGVPLGKEEEIVFSGLGVDCEVDALAVGVGAVDPGVAGIVLLVEDDDAIPDVAVEDSAVMIEALVLLPHHDLQLRLRCDRDFS